MEMHIVVIGDGQLGSEFIRLGATVLSHRQIDIADPSCRLVLRKLQPDVIVNTAARHAFGACEEDPAGTYAVNTAALHRLVDEANDMKAKLVQISTNYVFDGAAGRPYRTGDAPRPLSVYGASKLAAEGVVLAGAKDGLVVRVSTLFGVRGPSGKGLNFPDQVVRRARAGEIMHMVADQVTSPTYTHLLAECILRLIAGERRGLVHVAASDHCSYLELALATLDDMGLVTTVIPATTDDVRRPLFAPLHPSPGCALPPWREQLRAYLEEKHGLH